MTEEMERDCIHVAPGDGRFTGRARLIKMARGNEISLCGRLSGLCRRLVGPGGLTERFSNPSRPGYT